MPRMKRRDFERMKEIAARGGYTVDNELIRGLVAHAEAIDKELDQSALEYGQAMQNIDRLTENVAQLQVRLDAKEPGPVEISQAAAEAFKFYRQTIKSPALLYNADNIQKLAKDDPKANKHAVALSDLIFWKGLRGYYTAVFYGFTVEKTKEERLRDEIIKMVGDWYAAPGTGEHELDKRELATGVADFVTKFNDENK